MGAAEGAGTPFLGARVFGASFGAAAFAAAGPLEAGEEDFGATLGGFPVVLAGLAASLLLATFGFVDLAAGFVTFDGVFATGPFFLAAGGAVLADLIGFEDLAATFFLVLVASPAFVVGFLDAESPLEVALDGPAPPGVLIFPFAGATFLEVATFLVARALVLGLDFDFAIPATDF